ncbi:MAG: histidine phosphatase family protein [Rhizobiales bacterium]|nr:histidine phosphatase family protein [Hyphomicrobiales bacterium]
MLRIVVLCLVLLAGGPAFATEAGWALLRAGGHVVFLRHADTPSAVDPASLDLSNCATQQNLTERGGVQARRLGALFAARAAPVGKVLTSAYCRCRDTARLAFEGIPIEHADALDFMPGDEAGNDARAEEVRKLALGYAGADNLVLVVNEDVILKVLNVSAREAEAVIVRSDGETLRVAGRIRFN